VTDKNSFEKIPKWLSEIKDEAGDDIIIMLIGNKKDLVD